MNRRKRHPPVVIPGVLDWRELQRAAGEGRPLRHAAEFRDAARQLADVGMDPAAIARSLGLRRHVVRDLLGLPED